MNLPVVQGSRFTPEMVSLQHKARGLFQQPSHILTACNKES
nr:MAG TPA: hypothetical protein [Caudoviricetes sp.]DAQ87325.1 MAG TPA: hypothetical protein [Caudoviricetes sp.]DAU06613.1 MAG TPA: hypothetical protein [Caudoviricetes sp.]